jgi:hypothetical protein
MTTAKLLFLSGSSDWISRAITWFSHGGVTHVALLSPDGEFVIEASGKGQPKGVRKVSYETFLKSHPECELCEFQHPDPEEMWDVACSQLGKGYDWSWYLGWLFRSTSYQNKSKWTCAEFIVWAAQESGKSPFSIDVLWHVKPYDLRMIATKVDKG